MDKPDPYGDWVLFGTNQGPDGSPLAIDEELLAAARNAWPHVLAHVRGELFDKALGAERTALAADIWDQVLRSVAKTRQRNQDHRPPISDLESYLIGVFHHRFNRVLKKEQKGPKQSSWFRQPWTLSVSKLLSIQDGPNNLNALLPLGR